MQNLAPKCMGVQKLLAKQINQNLTLKPNFDLENEGQSHKSDTFRHQ